MIDFECPHCGFMLTVETAHAGRHAWCRRCKRIAIVPAHLIATVPVAVQDGVGDTGTQSTASHPIPQMPGLIPVHPSGMAATTSAADASPPREDVAHLKARLAESTVTIERLNREIARLTTGLSQREKELVQYRDYGERAKRRVTDLEADLSKRMACDVDRVAELDRIQSLVDERDRQIRTLSSDLAKAQEVAASAERLAQELKTAHGDAASKEEALREYEKTVDSRNEAAEESRRRIDELEDRVRALSGEAEGRQAILAAQTEDLKRALLELDELRRHDSERSAEIEGLEGLLDERDRSLRAAEDECAQLRSRVAAFEADLQTQRAAFESKNAEIDCITGELASARESLAEALNENSRLEQAMTGARLECERGAEAIARLNAQIEEIQASHDPDETDLLRNEVDVLRRRLDEAHAENARLQSELTYPSVEPEPESAIGAVETEPAAENVASGNADDTVPDVVRPEDDDQRMLVDALLRFLGRR